MGEHIELNRSIYKEIIDEMIRNSQGAPVVTDKNVYQEGHPANKPLMRRIVGDLLLPGSRIDGLEHLLELHALALRKKFCLVLMEHYSNFDLPNFFELLEQQRCRREGDRGRDRRGGRGEAERGEPPRARLHGDLHPGGRLSLAHRPGHRGQASPPRGGDPARTDQHRGAQDPHDAAPRRSSRAGLPHGHAVPVLGPQHGPRPQGDRHLHQVLLPHGARGHQRQHAAAPTPTAAWTRTTRSRTWYATR